MPGRKAWHFLYLYSMRDITYKQITLRSAMALAVVTCEEETIRLTEAGELPKGDPFGIAKAAAFLGAKETSALIPHCHSGVSIDGMHVWYEILKPGIELEGVHLKDKYGVVIYGTAKSIGKTGIEMELLTGISVAALTIYDLFKNIDKNIAIENLMLLDKKGGKSDKSKYYSRSHSCALIVSSDGIVSGKKEDKVTEIVSQRLIKYNANITSQEVIAQQEQALTNSIQSAVASDTHFVFVIGGTGQSDKDISAKVVDSLVEKKLDGVIDAMLHYSLDRSGIAMVSRLSAGIIGKTTVITIPGSASGAQESMDAILPYLFHLRKMM